MSAMEPAALDTYLRSEAMAIVSGAIITAFMGFVSDHHSIATAMLVPGLCFAVVALFGARHR